MMGTPVAEGGSCSHERCERLKVKKGKTSAR